MVKGNASMKKLTCDRNRDASVLGSSPRISFNPDAIKDNVETT